MSYTPFLQEIKQQKPSAIIRADNSARNQIQMFHAGRRWVLIEARGAMGLWEAAEHPYGARVLMGLPARFQCPPAPAGHPGAIRAALLAVAVLALIWVAFNV